VSKWELDWTYALTSNLAASYEYWPMTNKFDKMANKCKALIPTEYG
jgi:hypothetical protein